ncbi:rRNA maturation RNase YbeY [Leeia sp. TBRC 13508]|uniref:Endoribonuclease YbeY n=1 Tax=Leeia speluncae TaxID=2884804 RepID=A0ABS8D347_9NEIS|nr:rRNA maturation RNase YbeY [Leeia speluncae]MCB6182604.1 rRNA maturation RNase YbeY [Leeia speluncae]
MAKASLELTIQFQVPTDGLPSREFFRKVAAEALAAGEVAEVTLRIVDEEEGRTLNRDYREKDYATNVLTFTFDDDMPVIEGLPLIGDIVMCAPVVAKEAAEQGKTLEAHYAHLLVHGMLHLQGFDHLEDEEAEEMETLETQLLGALGFADPYAGEKDGAIDD